jgi:hypothetical protein
MNLSTQLGGNSAHFHKYVIGTSTLLAWQEKTVSFNVISRPNVVQQGTLPVFKLFPDWYPIPRLLYPFSSTLAHDHDTEPTTCERVDPLFSTIVHIRRIATPLSHYVSQFCLGYRREG